MREALQNLWGASHLELELERDGKPLRKTYTVEGGKGSLPLY
jgi:hypothetical protein